MQQIQTILDHAERHCREHGVRFTNKRKQVLSGLLASQKALSAYELVDYCKTEYGESMPAMSVYRILDFLQEEGLAHKLNLANKYVACSHITCDHVHEAPQFLICSRCQKVKEISINKSTASELKASVELAGFHMISPQLEINCICDHCLVQPA
ncbi:Fe2+/Zn2+ uptake regulation protein [Hahella chejuensis KCTC 2396]|uniref:Fe2+/Zn2+ uptake regulation protein n=1 Tax=Hahella chejuensis (strain KCTC 2396) TaxID=349521 RepID=Q2SI05_HAHCH|nr:transcriptional repressor [Hahella chejuensis]ABC29719.1 Fe2+/Zn2+ uptake regulation protein [Hahella chejuensis KCTC 2396]